MHGPTLQINKTIDNLKEVDEFTTIDWTVKDATNIHTSKIKYIIIS